MPLASVCSYGRRKQGVVSVVGGAFVDVRWEIQTRIRGSRCLLSPFWLLGCNGPLVLVAHRSLAV